MKVFVSNQLPLLADALCQELFCCRASPFEKRSVVIPREEIKINLYLRFLKQIEVVTAIKPVTYRQLVQEAFPDLPSKMELIFRLETALEIEQMAYLQSGGHKRKLDLCEELASLFLKYLQRPREEIVQWLEKEGWQQSLWKKVFGKAIPTDQVNLQAGSFFFYHPTQMAPYEWAAFSQMDSSWFLLSPSEMFLGDFQTERQQRYLLRKASDAAKEDLVHYFQEDSLLLSNWGVCHRRLLHFFENEEAVELFQDREADSMLHLLQKEWQTLEKTESLPDHSIELHSAPSLLREVEIVWDLIQKLPGSILVLAPDIQSYSAAIEWVFNHRGGAYTIRGLEAKSQSPLLLGLEVLLELPKYRFSAELFEKLLHSPPFLKRFDLTFQDAETMTRWMADLHVRYDLAVSCGSWHEALKRAVKRLSSFTEAPLLSRFIEIVLKIEEHLSMLSFARTAEEWADFLAHLLETFFSSDETPDVLNSVLLTLRKENIQGVFPYLSIERAVQTALTNRSGTIQHSSPEAIRFASLRPGAITPSKTIIVMGLQEGSFPHSLSTPSFAELPVPSLSEEDRALFLEALLLAQDHFIMTYIRCHPEDGKPLRTSSLVEELIKDRKRITRLDHPHFAPSYTSFSVAHQPIVCPKLNKTIDTKVLKKLGRHPVQFFLEQSLGLRFSKKANPSEFLFSPLDMHYARSSCLKKTTGQIIDALEAQGKLPTGSFREVACLSIEKELKEYRGCLDKLGVETIFSLELSPYAQAPTQISADRWVAPAPKITLPSGETREIQGTIENLTPRGLLHHGEESLETLLKIWPIYCLTLSSCPDAALLLTKKGECLQPAVANPYAALQRYLGYLDKSLQSPSPLLPGWARRLFKEGKIPESVDDEIMQWASQRALLPTTETWVLDWKPYLHEVFDDLL